MQKKAQKFLPKAVSHLIFAKDSYRVANNSTEALTEPHCVQIRIGFEVHFFLWQSNARNGFAIKAPPQGQNPQKRHLLPFNINLRHENPAAPIGTQGPFAKQWLKLT